MDEAMTNASARGGLTYGELLRLTEGHGTSELHERIEAALRAREAATWRAAAEVVRDPHDPRWNAPDYAVIRGDLVYELCRRADAVEKGGEG